MSIGRHLRLDNVVTSFPELGPTIPDGGYSWVVLCGVLLVQITIPSVLSMYGIVLGYIGESKDSGFDIWSEKIILTPILFTAFWNLADPWTRMIVNMSSILRLVGIVGVILLSVGIVASGYLATGGVGAYLASSSAGAAMGIGASFITTLSDFVLRKYFRKKLLIALTLRNIGTSIGLVVIPALTNTLLHMTELKTGLLLMTIVFLPTAIGTLTFRLPAMEHSAAYSLLLSNEEDNELPIRITPEVCKSVQDQNDPNHLENLDYAETEEKVHGGGLFSEGSNMYSYEEPKEDVDLFTNPLAQSNSKWTEQLRVLKTPRFWAALIGWTGMKVSTVFFFISLPALPLRTNTAAYCHNWTMLSVIAGSVTFLPSFASYRILKATCEQRRLYFGIVSCLSGIILINLTYVNSFASILVCTLFGGTYIGCLLSCQDLPLYDVFSSETMRCAHKVFSTFVGVSILSFCFIQNTNVCLQLAAFLQILGGLYWILAPALHLIKSTRHRQSRTVTNRKV